jgi:transcriptional regulator with XRE-family HTH domain
MKDRLLKFLNKEQLSHARFAEIIGVQPSSISHILSGRNNPGFEFIQKILTNYPQLNAEWLILGKGNMFRQSESMQGVLFHDKKHEYSMPDPGSPPDKDSKGHFTDTYVNPGESVGDYNRNSCTFLL